MTPETAIDKPDVEPEYNCVKCGKLTRGYELCQPCRDRKHVALRGSSALLYTLGTPAATCQQRCGHNDDRNDDGPLSHRCHKAVGHKAPCYFSSMCVGATA